MSYTPNEGNVGYENALKITKDDNRTLWTDNCASYEVHNSGITARREE